MIKAVTIIALGLSFTSTAWSQLPPVGQVGKDPIQAPPASKESSPITVPMLPNAAAEGESAITLKLTLLIEKLPSVAAQDESAVTVTVSSFTFTGNTVIRTEELQSLVATNVGQTLTLDGLDQVVDSISKLYNKRGYTVARAYLPEQQSTGGVIQIAIVEGRVGTLNLTNNSQVRDERIQQTLIHGLCNTDGGKDCAGKLIEDKGLERAILLVKDLPGTTVTANLKPGQAVGTSDLDVSAIIAKSKAYSLGFDNFGSPSTGVTRLNASADFNNLSSNGDQLRLGIASSNTNTNTITGSASYSLPVGYEGLRAGLAFARSQYRLGGAFVSTQSHGISNAISANASYPFIRSINQSLYLRASGEVRGGVSSIDSLIGTSSQSSFKTNANVVRIGLSGDHIDSLGGGGYNVYGLTLNQGYLGTNDASDKTGAQTAGRFGYVSYNIARQQTLTGSVTLYSALAGQQANKNLDGSEQIGLGGPSSVRGYAGEGGGSTGANGTIELRFTMPLQLGDDLGNITYGLFYDRGWLKYYQVNGAALSGTSATGNSRSLSSYGLTLNLQLQARVPTPTSVGYFVRAMYGMHGMNNGQASQIDANAKGKFWLQGGVTF